MKNILYTRNFDEKIEENVNVILSPQFYWIKKIEAPIKHKFEANQIAHNIFELNNNEYYFDAIELNNTYYAIAIRKDLKLPIDKKYIKSIRIAQCEFNNIECLNLPNNFSLQKVEDIFFCFPGHKDDCICLYNVLDKLSLSNVEFNFFNKMNISKVSATILILSFIFLFLSFIIRGISYKNTLPSIEQKLNALSQYNLPLNTYQLDSIISKLKKENNYQIKLRQYLLFIQNTPLQNKEKFLELKVYKKRFFIKILSHRNFNDYFSKKFKIISSKQYNNKYEVTLDVK